MVANESVSLLFASLGSAGLLATELPWVTLVAVLMAGECYWLVYYVSMLMVYHAIYSIMVCHMLLPGYCMSCPSLVYVVW